jgi:hypothetical protein
MPASRLINVTEDDIEASVRLTKNNPYVIHNLNPLCLAIRRQFSIKAGVSGVVIYQEIDVSKRITCINEETHHVSAMTECMLAPGIFGRPHPFTMEISDERWDVFVNGPPPAPPLTIPQYYYGVSATSGPWCNSANYVVQGTANNVNTFDYARLERSWSDLMQTWTELNPPPTEVEVDDDPLF